MEKNKWKNKNLLIAFKNALSGIIYSIKEGRNLKIQLCFALIVIIFGILFKISLVEWMAVTIVIFMVIFAELMNTAIETIVDLYSMEYNEKSKIAKDVAAGGVTICAINSVIVGLIIFLPKILNIVIK